MGRPQPISLRCLPATVEGMKQFATVIAAAAVLGLANGASAQDGQGRLSDWTWKATGQAEVIDGDTIRLHGLVVRLGGIVLSRSSSSASSRFSSISSRHFPPTMVRKI